MTWTHMRVGPFTAEPSPDCWQSRGQSAVTARHAGRAVTRSYQARTRSWPPSGSTRQPALERNRDGRVRDVGERKRTNQMLAGRQRLLEHAERARHLGQRRVGRRRVALGRGRRCWSRSTSRCTRGRSRSTRCRRNRRICARACSVAGAAVQARATASRRDTSRPGTRGSRPIRAARSRRRPAPAPCRAG